MAELLQKFFKDENQKKIEKKKMEKPPKEQKKKIDKRYLQTFDSFLMDKQLENNFNLLDRSEHGDYFLPLCGPVPPKKSLTGKLL